MNKPWSLSTTVRNPDRILPFLEVLSELEGLVFDEERQIQYQILLIQNRLYKPINLPENLFNYYETTNDKMELSQAVEIFEFMKIKSSELTKDPGLRGRTSVAPLTKMGLAIAKKSDGKVQITSFGKAFLNNQIDLGKVFFRFLLKWQIPNPDSEDYKYEDGYDIKPFVSALRLINTVNEKCKSFGINSKGISKQEFALFVPTLVNYKLIDAYADKVVELRKMMSTKNKQEQKDIFNEYSKRFVNDFLKSSNDKIINKFLNNLLDYGDNAIRYFRLTRFIYIRGGGFYIDIENRRSIEIENLLEYDKGKSIKFGSREEYLDYLANSDLPKLPWESKEKLIKIVEELADEITSYEVKLKISNKRTIFYKNMSDKKLATYVEELREYRRQLQEQENNLVSRNIDTIEKYISSLENIYHEHDRTIALEKYSALGLHALNDALKIQPNYPVGDDNEPTFTAPAGKPDIECYYKTFNAICEVTMLVSRDQWYNEGQPIMRHLRDFEKQNSDKNAYCLFIAPSLHRDTLNTFWTSIKYEYEGKAQKIIPLKIEDFIEILKVLISLKEKGKFLSHQKLSDLYERILSNVNQTDNVNDWVGEIPSIINNWKKLVAA